MLLEHYNRVVARKHERFPHDRRMVGQVHVDMKKDTWGVYVETTLTPELMAKVKAAGLRPRE